MNKLLVALAVGTVAIATTPASAADRIVSGKRVGVDVRIASLETRLLDGISSRRIDRNEARMLRPQIVRLDQMARNYKADGFTVHEQSEVRRQIELTRQQLQRADGSAGYALWRDNQRFGFGR